METAAKTRQSGELKQELVREWLGIRELTQYVCVSERTLREWIHRADDALPAVRVNGKILVRRLQLDIWLERHAVLPEGSVDVDAIVDQLLRGSR